MGQDLPSPRCLSIDADLSMTVRRQTVSPHCSSHDGAGLGRRGPYPQQVAKSGGLAKRLDAHGHRDCLWAVIKNESLIASLRSSIHPPPNLR